MDIIRAWKDEEYRLSLSEEERGLLPENPAGLIELADAQMNDVVGGRWNDTSSPKTVCGWDGCGPVTWDLACL